ncbi:OLC1v1019218C1 [Oldenlandia corymbosa var. corymbosa]|uniref:OLC1v1019218C1 n=1 Tax=Oldenlandia corymbosa var. corymbosa TaxID=529605 RepID=A0AAV1EDH5_OLDCO|nr:OLC1v1019218C1 [Oldenlandia corymbosa var. corymbosa]
MDPTLDRSRHFVFPNVEELLIEWKELIREEKSRGCRDQGRQVTEITGDYNQMLDPIAENITQLGLDWFFLKMLWNSMEYSNAYQFVMSENLFGKIHGVADEVLRDLWSCEVGYAKFDLKRSHDVLRLLADCKRKTDELIETWIQAAVKDLSNSDICVQVSGYEDIRDLFDGFIVQNRWSYDDDAGKYVVDIKLVFLYRELSSICLLFDSLDIGKTPIETKLKIKRWQVASVILKIVVQSCDFWFNRKDTDETANVMATEMMDLLQEIDPTNLEFLRLVLAFLKTAEKTPWSRVDIFCRYLLNWFDREHLEKELLSLVSIYIGNRGKSNMQSFYAEIEAVLQEAAFVHRPVQREVAVDCKAEVLRKHKQNPDAIRQQNLSAALPPCSELLAKICFLKAEFFLKQQLTLFSDNPFFRVRGILSNLRAFKNDLCQQHGNTNYVKKSLILAEELAKEIQSLQTSLKSKRITSALVNHSLFLWLFRILFFKAESTLTELLKSSNTSIAHKMDQIQYLVKELLYFKSILTTKLEMESNPSDDETVFMQLEDVAREITLFSYSYLPDHKRFEKIVDSLPQLLDKVKRLKSKLPEISHHLPKSVFPKTFQLGFSNFLCRNIRELQKHDPETITLVKHYFEEVLLHLVSFKSFMVKVKDTDVEQGELKNLKNLIRDASYRLEFVVDSIEFDSHQSLWFYDVLEDIRLVDQQVHEIHERPRVVENENTPQMPSRIISKVTAPETNEMLVDLVDEENAIVERLTRGSSQRDVVSIVGMPGIGKSTLARKVFNNRNVECHFHRRAWCTVSQTYSKRELLLELLSHIDVLTDDISKLTDDDLMSKLRRYLLRNKYLIVMDDIWDTVAWYDLEKCFPHDNNGSRILTTSRHRDVVNKIKPDSDPHPLRPFSEVESWNLLEKKIFKGAACPKELLEVGKEIAQQCQGLPLAIVTIAGLLQKLESNKDSWIKVSKSLNSEIIRNPESRCKEILELSYTHLPEYLKACFIYLGGFLEDKDIHVCKLIRCWMAEGFIEEVEWKSLEEVAEDYLMELINRSLVNIHKRRSNGKVKTCRLHGLLLDLCHLKAKEENFQQLVTKHDEPYASFPDSEFDLEVSSKNLLAPVIFESYRLSFNVKRPHFVDSQPSGPVSRSLMFASSDSQPKCPYDISFICHNFKLLRLLDLESIMATSFPVEIGLMVQLRYLALSGYMQSIPPSISNLWKLETLVVMGSRGKVILPETIWSMVRLRHLHVNSHAAFNFLGLHKDLGSSFQLENLVTFSTPSLSCRDDRWRTLKRFPNLRKLRCIFWKSGDSSKESSEVIRWNFLTHLESLKIICYGGSPNSGDFLLPQSLVELTLSNFCLQENHLSVVGKLPNLRVLKLHAGAFEGQKWEMREEEFEKLKFLELDTMNLVEWDASYEHLPSLERLVLRNCKDLKRIPCDFASIVTLQKVQVHWCGQSVEVSAKEIGDETPEIKVDINRS